MYVAVFGKHPGWNDHIDDIGLETDRLVFLKRVLYVEGIGATIDSGGWEKLHESQRLEGFAHVIVWRTGEDLVVARMWSSRDGKGRTKYPMVVCVQVRGVGVERALRRVLPVLERAERACRDGQTAQDVLAVLDGVRSELRTALGSGDGPDVPDLSVPASAIASAAASPAFAGQPEGPARILYQIEREMAPFLAHGAGGKTRLGTASPAGRSRLMEVRPQQIRVPALSENPEENALAWLRFMLALLDGATPIMLVMPLGQPWTDVLVGQPVGTQFYCLRATPKALPLTSDIPYTLDDAFAEAARRLTSQPLEGGDIVVRRQAARAVAGAAAAPKRGWFGGSRALLLAGLIGVGAVGIIAAVVASRPGGPEVPRAGPEDRAAEATQAATGSGTARGNSLKEEVGEGGAVVAAGAWEELCRAYRDWVGLLVRELDGPAGEVLLRDPHLGPKLACLRNAAKPVDPWSIAGVDRGFSLVSMMRNPPEGVRTPEAEERVNAALGCVRALEGAIEEGAWPRLDGLRARREWFARRGWGEAAALAETAVAAVEAGPGGASLVKRLASAIETAEAAEHLEGRWGHIEAAAAALEKTGDPVAARFGAWAAGLLKGTASGARESPDPAAGLRACAARLDEAAALARDLTAFVGPGGGWEGVDALALREGGRVHAEVAAGRAVDAAVFRDWLFQAPGFPALDPAADPRRRWDGSAPADLARAGELAARLGDKVEAGDAAALSDLRRRAAELAGLRWAQGTREQIERETEQIEHEAATLRRSMERALVAADAEAARSFADAARGLRERAEVTGSAALNAAWVRWRDALIAELEGSGDAAELGRRARQIETVLTEMDASVPGSAVGGAGAGAPWMGAIRAAAGAERERILAEVVEGLSPGSDLASKAAAQVQAATGAMTEAVRRLERLAGSLIALEEQLNLGFGLTEQGGAGGKTVESLAAEVREAAARHGPAVVGAAGGVLARVDALAAVAQNSDHAALRRLVEQARADRPEEAINAWRRLGQTGWPASDEDLSAELGLHAVLARVLETLPEARRRALGAEVAAELPRRWMRTAARQRTAAGLDAVLAMREACGVQAAAIEAPAMRFNALAHDLKGQLTAGVVGDDAARAAVRAFLDACSPLKGSLGAEQHTLLSALEPLVASDGPAPVDPATLGPGTAPGWTGKTADGGRTVTFTRGGGAGEVTLRFYLVETSAGRAYVQDTELSLGQAVAIIGSRGGWKDFVDFVPVFSETSDPRLGPRGWVWEERGGVSVMRPADAWLQRIGGVAPADLYAAGIDPGQPSADHPLQQIPPDAAVCIAAWAGCRLPTSAEWGAAVAVARNDGGAAEPPNLRDATWRRQLAHVDAARRAGKKLQWPDAGVFWPAGDRTAAKDRTATAHDSDDGVLWLAPVGTVSAGARFAHLVGNVAEYTFDEPSALAGLASPEVDAVRGLLRQHAAKLSVIGGSALSAPELPLDTPLPVEFEESLEVGYADVGMRLAFDADGVGARRRSLAARAAELLGPEVYVLP